jgi:peptide/nickel transport system substrate-binding protein
MNRLQKKIRYYYWLILSFIKKNLKLAIFSFILSFFLILLLINLFPFFSAAFFRKQEKIGWVGKFNLQNPPDEIVNLISNPLLTIDEKGGILPVLAKSWEISSDAKTYRLYLKPELYWSDEEKFTAYDINYQFKEVAIKPIDATTIEFKLNQPLAIFPVYLTKPIIKYPLKGVAGLYQVESYKLDKGNLTTLYLLPNRPDLPVKIYRFYEREDALITGYKKGDINILRTSKKNIAELFSTWKNTKVESNINYNQILTLFFNTNNKILSTKEIRKALAYATPFFEEWGKPANGPISPTSWAYFADLKRYHFNLEKAEALFTKNLNASAPGELNFYTFYDYIEVAEKIKQSYEKIGLKINLHVLSYLPQEFDLLLTVWSPPSDPDQYYFWHSTQKEGNITNYRNLKVDKLLEDGRRIINVEERKKIYTQFQEIIMEDLPAYFLCYPYVYTIERK